MIEQPPSATILIVEDNVTTRELITGYLRPKNYTTLVANHGQEALALLDTQDIDLVMCDILMPVMDGYQLLKAMRADETLQDIPVVVISAIGDMESVLTCLELGADDYLYKPINRGLMLARIENSLEKKSLHKRSIKHLQELNSIKDQVVGALAHEMKNPIALMIGFIDLMLEDDGIADESQYYLSNVRRYAFEINELVQDMLDLSKIDVMLRKTDIDLGDLVSQAVEDIRILANQKSITTVYEPPANTITVAIDVDRIRRVLSNLLSNAVKYTLDGGHITVKINTNVEHKVVVSVSDTGLGIPANDIDKIFDSFYRVQDEAHRTQDGSGLGLSIAKTVVEQHGGRIWVESEMGQGSHFHFSLPYS